MLAGFVVVAVGGGLAGLAYAVQNDHSLFSSVLAYQLGGLIAITGYVIMCQAARQWKA